jgi:hypothetical protein
MRRLLLLIPVLISLSGCARPVQEETIPAENAMPIASANIPSNQVQQEDNSIIQNAGESGATAPVAGPNQPQADVKTPGQAQVPPANQTAQKPQPTAAKSNDAAFIQIPNGPLDDAKYIAISVKYTTSLLNLPPEKQKDSELARQKLSRVLKEANVTLSEFAQYTASISENQMRQEKVTDAIMKLVEKQAKTKLRDKPQAKVDGLQVLGKMEEKDLPEGEASKHK